jgi:protein TonB
MMHTCRTLACAVLALAGLVACAQAPIPQPEEPGATRLLVERGIDKHKRLPVGECAPPTYPLEARRYELEGVATVYYRLLPDGRVSAPRVAKSSGWAILDAATIALAMGCKYTPRQAAEAGGAELPLQFAWTLEGERAYAGIVPGSCESAGRFDGFQPHDHQATDAQGIKVRFLIDKAGAPFGIKLEAAGIDPVVGRQAADYLQRCRFAFDAQLVGTRTDVMQGRILLR